jgi:hypothetical protein
MALFKVSAIRAILKRQFVVKVDCKAFLQLLTNKFLVYLKVTIPPSFLYESWLELGERRLRNYATSKVCRKFSISADQVQSMIDGWPHTFFPHSFGFAGSPWASTTKESPTSSQGLPPLCL